jgi:hypothetical protein
MTVHAESKDKERTCLVKIRVIEGLERGEEYSGHELEEADFLEDVRSQLEPLPFKKYRVIQRIKDEVLLGKKLEFDVRDAEGDLTKLIVLPEKLHRRRVQVRVDWKGSLGEELLSTKFQMKSGHSVIFGSDASEHSSTIFCIKVDCSNS